MTIDAEFMKNYLIANQRGSEDDVVLLNMMSGGKPHLDSTTEPREYRAPGEYCSESAFATDCLAARMMGAWDAEVGRPIPEKASESYRQSYAREREKNGARERETLTSQEIRHGSLAPETQARIPR